MKLKKDVASGMFFILLSVLLFVLTFSIKLNSFSQYGSAGLVPRIIAGLMFLLGSILIFSSAMNKDDETNSGMSFRALLQLSISVVSLILYYLLLSKVGFIIMTTLLSFLQMMLLSNWNSKKWPLFAGVSVVVTVCSYLLFSKVFLLVLPYGVLG